MPEGQGRERSLSGGGPVARIHQIKDIAANELVVRGCAWLASRLLGIMAPLGLCLLAAVCATMMKGTAQTVSVDTPKVKRIAGCRPVPTRQPATVS